MNDGKTDYVVAKASDMIDSFAGEDVACLGLAFKANIDDFRESPAVKVAARLARRYGRRIKLVEPYAHALPMEFAGTGAELIDLDTALEQCGVFDILVDHDMFKSVPVDERVGKAVYDTRGIWPDQPRRFAEPAPGRIAV